MHRKKDNYPIAVRAIVATSAIQCAAEGDDGISVYVDLATSTEASVEPSTLQYSRELCIEGNEQPVYIPCQCMWRW